MTSAVQLYEALATAPDDKTRAKLIAEAFERLEERYPHLPDLATQAHLRETELRLRKEIEQVRAELKADLAQVKVDLIKWIVPLMFAQVAVIAALVKLL
jgi:hypothetical protein